MERALIRDALSIFWTYENERTREVRLENYMLIQAKDFQTTVVMLMDDAMAVIFAIGVVSYVGIIVVKFLKRKLED